MKPTGKTSLTRFCFLLFVLVSYADTFVLAAPKGGRVVSGSATFQQDGNLTTITAGNRSIINYGSFNIAAGETVRFVQPSASSTVLNRVVGSTSPTEIFGSLQANGRVVLANPYGIFFQNGSVVSVGGLIAGAGHLSDADFAKGKIKFTDLAGDVRNDGIIAADNRIALMGANVINTGSLKSTTGMAMMVSGDEVYVGEKNGNIFVQANGKSAPARTAGASGTAASRGSVVNSGTVTAPRILIGGGDLYSTAISNSGLLQGRQVTVNAGRNGSATVGGTLDASSASNRTSTGKGGTIEVTGGTVALKGATLNASGEQGGGTVRVGGDFHGKGTLAHAQTTSVDVATVIKADATGATGNGGNVVLWSDARTQYDGSISARGGASGGNGGSAEVSSADQLAYRGATDLRAPAGATGSLLLDPHNITIGGLVDDPLFPLLNPTVAFADFGPGTNITITAATLITALAAANVTLQANTDINFTSGVNSTLSANNLTLNAGRSILFSPNIALTLGGAFTATINDGGANPQYRDANPAAFTMNTGSSITARGGVTISAGNLAQSGDGTTVTPSTVADNTGTITLTDITTSSVLLNTASGAITVTNNLAARDILVTGTLNTSPATGVTAPAGNVSLNAGGTLTAQAIDASSAGAAAADVALTGGTALNLNGAITGQTLTATGPINLNAGGQAVTTSGGAQLYTGSVTLGATGANPATTLTAGGGTIEFTSTVNSATGTAQALTLDTTGQQTFGGLVGGTDDTTALASLTTGSGPVAINGGGVRTAGSGLQSYPGAVTLGQNTALVGGNVSAPSGIDAQNHDLTLTLSGVVNVSTNIVNVANFVSNGAGRTNLTGNFTTGGFQHYDNNTSLGNNVVLTAGTDGIRFGGPTGGFTLRSPGTPYALNLTTNGPVAFGGVVGGGNAPLASLTKSGMGTTAINGGAVTTTGGQDYGGAVTLGVNTVLTGSTLALSTLAGNSNNLTLTFGNAVTIPGAAYTGINDFTSNGAGGTILSGGFATAGFQNYQNAVTLSGPTTLSTTNADPTAGAITFSSTVGGAFDLTTSTQGGNTVFGPNVASVPGSLLASLTTSANGTTIFGNTALTTSGPQNYQGAVLIAQHAPEFALTLTSNNAGITFGNSLNATAGAPSDLTLNAANGTVTFNGPVGGTLPIANPGAPQSATALNSLTVNAAGVALNGGLVNTSSTAPLGRAGIDGTQTYNAPVVLGADTTFVGSTLTVGAPNVVNAQSGGVNHDLTLTLSGRAVVSNALYTNVRNFISNGSGDTNITGDFTTTGFQHYDNVALLGNNAVLTAGLFAAQDSIRFGSTLNNLGSSAFNLTLSTGGPITFVGAVGGASPLGSLAANGGVVNVNGGLVHTTNLQTYNGPVLLGATPISPALFGLTTFQSDSSGVISFASTVDASPAANTAPQSMVVSTGGALNFFGAVGSNQRLFDLDAEAGQVNVYGSLVRTGGTLAGGRGQIYGGPVRIYGPTDAVFLDDTASPANPPTNNLVFNSTLDNAVAGTPNLTLATTGNVVFNNLVGGNGALGNFTVRAGGTVFINGPAAGGLIRSSGSQSFQNFDSTLLGQVVLGVSTTFTSLQNGALTFNASVDSANGTQSLTANTGGLTLFNGLVGSANALAALTTDDAGVAGEETRFNMAIGAAAQGVRVSGAVTVNDAVRFNASGSTVNQPTVRTGVLGGSGTQTYARGGVVAQGTALQDENSGTITFGVAGQTGRTLNAATGTAPSLFVSTGGDEIFNDLVGNTARLGNLQTDAVGPVNGTTRFNMDLSLAGPNGAGVDVVGSVSIADAALFNAPNNLVGGVQTIPAVRTGGGQTYQSQSGPFLPNTLAQNTVLRSTGGGDIQFFGAVDNQTNTAARDLAIYTSGGTIFNARVGSAQRLNSLTTDDGGFTLLNGLSVNTVNFQDYGDRVLLGTDNGLSSLNSYVNFRRTVDSVFNTYRALTIEAGTMVQFGQNVGLAGSLGSLLVTAGQETRIFAATILTARNGDDPTAAGYRSGDQTFNGPVRLFNGSVTLQSDRVGTASHGGNVTFNSLVDGSTTSPANALTVNTGGLTSFNAPVGSLVPLASLTTDYQGAVDEQTRFIFNLGAAAQGVGVIGAVTLRDSVLFQVSGSTVNQPTVRTGLLGVVGSQTYGTPGTGTAVTLAQDTVLLDASGGNLTFNATVDSLAAPLPYNLTLGVADPGSIVLNGRVGGSGRLGSLTTLAGGLTQINGGLVATLRDSATVNGVVVSTTGAQTYNNKVFLGNDAVLSSTAGAGIADQLAGNIRFASTVDSAIFAAPRTLTVNTNGVTEFDAPVGATSDGSNGVLALGGLITDAGGITFLNGGSVTTVRTGATTGEQTFRDAVRLGLNTTLTSLTRAGTLTAGDISFAQTLDSNTAAVLRDLVVLTSGTTLFGGWVGGQFALGSLSTDAPGLTQINADINTISGATRPDSLPSTGAQTFNDAVELLNAAGTPKNITLTSRVGGSATTGGDISFASTLDGNVSLALNTTGTTRFGVVNSLGNVTSGAVGNTIPLAGLFTDTDPLVGVGGETQFNMLVGSARAGVTVDGPVQINDAVVFNIGGASLAQPSILTRGTPDRATQIYNGPVRLNTTTFLTSSALTADGSFTGGGSIVFAEAGIGVTSIVPGVGLFVRAGVGTLEFDKPVNVDSLEIGGANVIFRGPVSLLGPLSVLPNDPDTSGTIKLLDNITTRGLQQYSAGVCLGNNIVLTSLNTLGDGGNITFGGIVYSDPNAPVAYSLTVNTPGDEIFNGLVGTAPNGAPGGALASLTTDNNPSLPATGTASFRMSLNLSTTPAGAAGVNVLGEVNINDNVEFRAAGSSLADASHLTVLSGGAQTYRGAAILSQNTSLFSRNGGTLTFVGTVDSVPGGSFGLAASSAGNQVFGGLVGRTGALASLTTDVLGAPFALGGQTQFNMDTLGNGPGVRVTGDVTLNDAVAFNALNVALTNPDQSTVFSGGNQTYNGAATLGANTALTSQNGFLLFNNTVDGAFGLATNSPVFQEFRGLVGGGTPLASLTANGGDTRFTMALTPAALAGVRVNGPLTVNGTTLFAITGAYPDRPAILTLGTAAQTYNGAARLGAGTLLRSGGDLLFSGTVNGAYDLTLDVSGALTFNGAVGNLSPLASLSTTSNGITRLNTGNAGTITTTGLQTYLNPVTLLRDETLVSTQGGDLTFGSTVDGAFSLVLDSAGNETFNARVGGTTPLASLTTDPTRRGGTTVLNIPGGGVSILTSGAQTYNDGLTLRQATTLTSTGGLITVPSVAGGGFNLNVNGAASTFGAINNGGAVAFTVGGLAAFNGPIGAGSLFVQAGTINLNAGTVVTGGSQSYLASSVSLGQSTTIQAGGTVQFDRLLANKFDLTLNSRGATFAEVDDAGALDWTVDGPTLLNGNITARSLRLDSGDVTLAGNDSPRTIQTEDFQIFTGQLTLQLDTRLVSTGGGTISVGSVNGNGSDLLVRTGGNADFGRITDEGGVLDFQVEGTTTFTSKVSGDSLTVAGQTAINGGADGTFTIRTTNDQTYRREVTLGAAAILVSTNGQVSMLRALLGRGQDFTVEANTGSFQSIEGTNSTQFTTAGTLNLNGTITAGSLEVLARAGTDGGLNLAGGSVATDRFQNYAVAVALGAATTLTSQGGNDASGAITFGSRLDGSHTLLVDTVGTTTFGGAVGENAPLTGLTIANGATQVNGGLVNTVGSQVYRGAVGVDNAVGTRFAAGTSDLIFDKAVTGTRGTLSAEAHRLQFNDDVTSAGNLTLTATLRPNDANTSLLLLGGLNYTSRDGSVLLNAYDRTAQSAFSNVVFTNSGSVVVSGLGFSTGYLQKIFASGSLTIDARGRNATFGDLAAAQNLTVRAGSITLLNRPALETTAGRGADTGLNFVAGNRVDFGSTPLTYRNGGNQVANFITRNGDVSVARRNGVSFFSDPNVNAQFTRAYAVGRDGFLTPRSENFGFANPFQPVSGGVQSLDTAAALAGALPDQKPLEFPVEVNITASQEEELTTLGISNRRAVNRERGGITARRALFAQLVDDGDPDNFGRLQPVKGGISRLKPSDYVVVVDRMSEREVRSVLQAFDELYGKKREKVPELSASYQAAYNDYAAENPTGEPAGFAPYLAGKQGKYPALDNAARGYDNLFGYVEHMGLTTAEITKAENRIVQTMAENVQGPTTDDMVKVINAQRQALPAGKKAPSTKLPPAPPAAATPVAPAATPAPKKAAPPVQAQRQPKADPVHPAQAAPADDHHGDLAGL